MEHIQEFLKDEVDLRFVVDNLLTGFSFTDLSFPLDRTLSSIIAVPERESSGFMSFASPGFKKDSYTKTFVASFANFKKALDTNTHGEGRPCIFCGYCEDVCPVGIIPHLIYRNVERDKVEEHLVSYRIFNCMDCNLCTYVCPSKIRVASYVQKGKDSLRTMGISESGVVMPAFQLRGIPNDEAAGEDRDT
jgi:Na+-translocating ferredoxin:NAD+ oxidoreductase RnfC subunit